MPDTNSKSALPLTTDPGEDRLEDTLALCLSGGGYRAMLFHLGTLWYLNDAKYLPSLARVSSVSGGSITAGVLATRWSRLAFGADGKSASFAEEVAKPLLALAGTTIDVGSIVGGVFLPGSVSDRVSAHYRDELFGKATLQDFPDDSGPRPAGPRFVVNATNVQTLSLFRFSRPYLADWRIGRILNPRVSVADAVAASSAFPPFLSPVKLELDHESWTDLSALCGTPPYTTRLLLSDGGVYDNMGIETAWKRCRRVLVSDGGARYQPQPRPHRDWAFHSIRVNETIDNQVRSLRRRQVVGAFASTCDPHEGAYWGIGTTPSDYTTHALPVDDERALELSRIPTRLAAMDDGLRDRVVNLGYAMAERAIRSWFDKDAFVPPDFPLPGGV